MDLQASPDETQIIDTAASFLGQEWPVSRLHRAGASGFNAAARRSFAALGWFGIGLPESSGGAGFGVVEEMLLHRELGRVLAPIDILSISLAARICAEHAPEAATHLLAGDHGVAFCVDSAPGMIPATHGSSTAEFRCIGCDDPDFAVFFSAGEAVVAGIAHGAVDRRPCLDKSVAMGALRIDVAKVIARVPARAIVLTGRLMVSAMAVGICEAVTAMIVEYAKIRRTFGRPIGAYQAVRHPCADMAVRSEAARAQLFHAGVSLRDGLPDSADQVNAAKLLACESALLNAESNIQLHGGIGTTDEHDAHLYLKRARLLGLWLGGAQTLSDELLSDVSNNEMSPGGHHGS